MLNSAHILHLQMLLSLSLSRRALAFFRVETHVESPAGSRVLWDREAAPTRELATLFSLYSRFVNRNTRNIPADAKFVRSAIMQIRRMDNVSVDFTTSSAFRTLKL